MTRKKDHAEFWMVLAVLACLTGSVPRGIGQPVPPLSVDSADCWLPNLPATVECVVSQASAGIDLGLRLLPLLDGGDSGRW